MRKELTKHKLKMLALQKGLTSNDEGKWRMSFTIGGKTTVRVHQFNPQEIKHMKDLCVEFGDLAADQIIWRSAIKGIEMAAQRLIIEAAIEFIKEHRGEDIKVEKPSDVSYKKLLRQEVEQYVEDRAPLPDEKAFDPEEHEKIVDQTVKGL